MQFSSKEKGPKRLHYYTLVNVVFMELQLRWLDILEVQYADILFQHLALSMLLHFAVYEFFLLNPLTTK